MTVVKFFRNTARAAAAFGLIGSVLALAGCGAPTYGTGRAPEMAMFEELTGNLTGTKKKKNPIEYQARGDLVLPPDTQLPPPEQQTALSQTAAWPDDPDRKRAANTSGEIPEEFRRGRLARGTSQPDSNVSPIDVTEMNPAQRREAERKFREQRAAMSSGDPTKRRYLTEPPVDYRVPSPDAPQPDTFEENTEPRTLFGSLWKRFRN